MINLDKKHYAITIETTYTLSNSAIGLDTGTFRWTTDGYQPTGTDTYEDSSPVVGTWYGNVLNRDGIKPATQSIDIIIGGDYSWASSLKLEVVNWNGLHKQMLNTSDLYIIGSKMTLYVIIDGVWYPRWTGSLSDYEFDDKLFIINGKDINNSDSNIIKDTLIGRNYSSFVQVEQEAIAFLDNKLIKQIQPFEERLFLYNQGYNTITWPKNPYSVTYYEDNYNGGDISSVASTYDLLANNSMDWLVYLNGHIDSIKRGQYIKFSGDDNFYFIENVFLDEFPAVPANNIPIAKYTKVQIRNITSTLTDYAQFFGKQPIDKSSNLELWTETNSLTGEKLFVSIFERGLYLPPIKGGYIIIDNKLKALDKDQNELLIPVIENGDGSLTLQSDTVYKIIYPSRILFWEDDNNGIFTTELGDGLAKNIQTLGTTITIPNDCKVDGDYFECPTIKPNKYFNLTFSESIDDAVPFVVISGLVDANEAWRIEKNLDNPDVTNPRLYEAGYASNWLDYPSANYSNKITSFEDTANQFFTEFNVDIYKIVNEINSDEGGSIPLAKDDFGMPNTRYRLSIDGDSHDNPNNFIRHIRVKSTPVTNLPASEVKWDSDSHFISINKNILGWKKTTPMPFDNFTDVIYYPGGQISSFSTNDGETIDASPVQESPFNLMLRIYPGSIEGAPTVKVISKNDEPNDQRTFEFGIKMWMGINSIGVYKKTVISSIEDLFIPTHNTDNDTLPLLLGELTNTTPQLPTRDNWFVGGQVIEEQNKFNIVTTLCKQSFISGWTNRSGTVSFKDFLNDDSAALQHSSTNLLVDKSISGFKLSPIEKCFNEFTVKYNKFNNEFLKEYGVYKVDSDSFPVSYGVPVDNKNNVNPLDISNKLNGITNQYMIRILETANDGWTTTPNIGNTLYGTTNENGYTFEAVVYDKLYSSGGLAYWCTITSTTVPQDVVGETININSIKISGYGTWDDYVKGVSSYPDAKAIWEEAHSSWLLNKRIRKATTDRTDLEYAIDMNTFYGVKSYDPTVEYAWNYFKLLVEWTTKQKLQVNYNVPLTTDTVKYELMDKVIFSDPIITPTIGEYGNGWITSIGLDPLKNELKLGITFETMFFLPPSIIDGCTDIIETGYSLTDIIETGISDTDIIEGACV